MKLKRLMTFVFMLGLLISANAQQFITPSNSFSHKKPAYITMADGNELECTIDKIKRKKGLIKEVRVIDANGDKLKLSPEEIKFMYLPPSGIDKFTKATSFLDDPTKWNNDKLDQDFINIGYVYFEYTPVQIKKKTQNMMMQLLNPAFSKDVQVYHDPFAKETASVGIGGVKLAGGNAKSYYIKHSDDKKAVLLEKKKYKKKFSSLWDGCESLETAQPKWSDLVDHIIKYSECAQ